MSRSVGTTLQHRLERPLSALENELRSWGRSGQAAVVLVLPTVNPEVIDVLLALSSKSYVSELIVALEDPEPDFQSWHSLPAQVRFVWSQSPHLSALDISLQEEGLTLPPQQPRLLWYALGYLLASSSAELVAVYQGDDALSQVSALASLLHPLISVHDSVELSRSYYLHPLDSDAELTLLGPFLQALESVFGSSDHLQRLAASMYSISTGLAFRRRLAAGLRLPVVADMQLALFSELQRSLAVNKVCQIAHDRLSKSAVVFPSTMSSAMRHSDFAIVLLERLRSGGVVINRSALQALKLNFLHKALDCLMARRNDCQFNGLELDLHKAESAIERFAETVFTQGCRLADGQHSVHLLPSWKRALYAVPDLPTQLCTAIEKDSAEFSSAQPFIGVPPPADQPRPFERH